jgi:hypothetical protein
MVNQFFGSVYWSIVYFPEAYNLLTYNRPILEVCWDFHRSQLMAHQNQIFSWFLTIKQLGALLPWMGSWAIAGYFSYYPFIPLERSKSG